MLRIAMGQFNACVGDISGNIDAMAGMYGRAVEMGADILVFPEMCVCGYPLDDLLLKKQFLVDVRKGLECFAGDCNAITVLAGFAEISGGDCYNCLGVIEDGHIKKVYHKSLLPDYAISNERRYFKPGGHAVTVELNGVSMSLTICEEVWQLDFLDNLLKDAGKTDLIINISASPFHVGKIIERRQALSRCAQYFGSAVAHCNLIGGQDELVFDGRSMFIDSAGQVVVEGKAFVEDLLVADVDISDGRKVSLKSVTEGQDRALGNPVDVASEIYHALVLGTRDYVKKNGFSKVLIGLSGGIDSAIVAAVAVDALGSDNVSGVTMPSKFNSSETIADAGRLAANLGVELHTIPIESMVGSFDKALGVIKGWDNAGVAYENLQARIRGTILMSLSNQLGCMVLTTGNKSESAVGYATLYGDTAGGFAVISDVPKTMVYKLCDYVNKTNRCEVIPGSIISRDPSAELRDGQKDCDSLPDYDTLDDILKGYVEQEKSVAELAEEGLSEELVRQVAGMIKRAEYKRRQCPPGIKITPRAFGTDHKMPITNRYSQ